MKIRSRSLNKLIGVLGAGALRAWLGTLRYRVSCARPELDPGHPLHRGRYIYAFWHETILAMVGVRRVEKMSVLISRHQDGEYIAQVVERLGARVVRGSTRRGASAALLGLLEEASGNHLLITPDGPRGPRRRLQQGAVFLAARSGLPIVPIGFGFTNVWRAASWDRFAVPLPYSSVTCTVGEPVRVPAGVEREGLERWRRETEQALLRCAGAAEAWALRLRERTRLRGAA